MSNPGIDAYRRQQLEAMTPEQLVLVVFEQGVLACRKKDRRRAVRAVDELINALDPEVGEIADGMFLIYDWVRRLIREGAFEEAGRILDDLRATWIQAVEKERQLQASAAQGDGPSLPRDLSA